MIDNDNNDLENLPDELLVEINKYLSHAPDCLFLTATSNRFCSLFFNERQRILKAKLRPLLDHAALGEWNAAHMIWFKKPSLLTWRDTVCHLNPPDITPQMNPGRYKYVARTIWQIALMNEEYEVAEEMGRLMTGEEKQKQFTEIFPNGKLIKHNWDLEEAKKRLKAVFYEVIHDTSINMDNMDTMNDSTRDKLYKLYEYVKPTPEHRMGLVFDINLYVGALKLFEEEFIQFQNRHQHAFWCIRIEEHLASLLGTGYLFKHAQGIIHDICLNTHGTVNRKGLYITR
jgi:hypothetical protein